MVSLLGTLPPARGQGQEEVAEQNRAGLLVEELHNGTRPRRSVPGGERGADRTSHGVPGQLSVATVRTVGGGSMWPLGRMLARSPGSGGARALG